MSLSSAQLASAQPTGSEPRHIHAAVDSLRESIAEAGRRIEDRPGDAQLYAARGSLYADLYRSLYEGSYRWYYGPKPPELAAAAITTKAIEDFGRAVGISPSPELYDGRGEMYEARWADTVTAMRYGVWAELTRSPRDLWTLLTSPPAEPAELVAFGKLITDPDFASAAADYAEALRLSGEETDLARQVHAKFARLYVRRARAVPFYLPPVKKIIDEPNRYGYSVWADFDHAAEHLSRSSRAEEEKLLEPGWDWVWPRYVSRSRVYYEKARLAVSYEKYDAALEALNLAAQYVDPGRDAACEIYSERSKVHVKLGQFDAAIADADRPDQYGGFCLRAYEPRGDAYLARGDWRAAVADYTAGLKNTYSETSVKAYKHRALAYSRLGEAEKAINDLTAYLYLAAAPKEPEVYRLRARLYRKLGKKELALADEKTAEEIFKEIKSKVEEVYVLGEIRMPDGVPFDLMMAEVMLVDVADPKKRLWATAGADARFIVGYEKGRSFTIHVFHDGVKGGRPGRFYGRTRALTANGTVGPLTITLGQFFRKK